MKKYGLICITSLLLHSHCYTQNNVFDVFTYVSPLLFSKSELPSRTLFKLTNNDGNFCTITLYKSTPAKSDAMKDVIGQWNEQVVKKLTKANKKPLKILTEQLWDGWASTLAIGNFYHNKKKCVVMLNSFRKGSITACVVFTLSDSSFKRTVEQFSKELHLIQ